MTRTIVITGSTSGIGRAAADLLRAQGDRVIGVDLREADVIADLSGPAGIAAMVAAVDGMTGGVIDGLIANAGVLGPDALCYAVNYHGVVGTITGLRPMLARSTAPRAVVTASLAASRPIPSEVVDLLEAGGHPGNADGNAYAWSKAAIARWVRRHAPDWARAGILLNAICPGITETPMADAALKDPSAAALLAATPLRRLAKPAEMAGMLAFLSGTANSFMVGQVIYVDGGLDAVMRPAQV